MRNIALTLAAVALRIEMPIMTFWIGLSFPTAYVIVSWLCRVPNLLVAERVTYRSRDRFAPVP